jgi:ABC-type sugar transport system permease subunit
MDKFLEVIGALGVCLVLVLMGAMVINSGSGSAAFIVLMGLLPWAIPAIVGFILVAAFGNMLGQLKAIRSASERHVQLFSEIIARRKSH